jgi:glycosyltransferase involved in cell wall biosynthesis
VKRAPNQSATYVSCVIPVFNEAARLPAVLAAVANHPMIAEVIVVDDGSTDDSAEVAKDTPGVTLIRQQVNGGKTKALAAGIAHAQTKLLLFLDGDLLGLTPEDISRLIAPIARGDAEISISLRGNSPWPWRLIGLDYISGERVLHRDLLPDNLQSLHALPNFGFEVYLNRRLVACRARIAVIRWPDVKSPLKNRKYGLFAGILADLRMMGDIFKTVPPWRLLGQIAAMKRLCIHR